MIGKVSRGWRVAGLIRYLLGPGRFNEHRDPRVIASWDGRPSAWQPPRRPDGRVDVGDLAAALALAQVAGGIPQHEPAARADGKTPKGPVWHCSLRTHPDDPVLSDRQWREIAREVVHRTGIAPRDDAAGCRWVVVRHAEDHVHIAAVLVRLDTGRRVHPKFDHRTVRQVCRETETRLGLVPTGDADRTAPRYPTRAEQEKVARYVARTGPRGDVTGGRSAREFLCSEARRASLQARSPEEFLERLASPAVKVRLHRDQGGRIDGYALARVGDRDAAGELVWFPGSRLARDLSMARLQAVWASADPPPEPLAPEPQERRRPGRAERLGALGEATRVVEDATAAVHAAREDDTHSATMHDEDFVHDDSGQGRFVPDASPPGQFSGDDAEAIGDHGAPVAAGVAHSLRDLLIALDLTAHHAYPELGNAARLFDRAARTPRTVLPSRWTDEARRLRTAAWRLAAAVWLPGHGPAREPLDALVAAVAALVAELAAYQATRQRLAQAHAARRCADALTVAADERRRPSRPRIDDVGRPRVTSRPPTSAPSHRPRPSAPKPAAPRPAPPTRPGAPGPDPWRRPGPGRGR